MALDGAGAAHIELPEDIAHQEVQGPMICRLMQIEIFTQPLTFLIGAISLLRSGLKNT